MDDKGKVYPSVLLTSWGTLPCDQATQLVVIAIERNSSEDEFTKTRGLTVKEFDDMCDALLNRYWPKLLKAHNDGERQLLVFEIKITQELDSIRPFVYAELMNMGVYAPWER
jgi:hypothetical protein